MWYVVMVKRKVGADLLICGEEEVHNSYSNCDYMAFNKYEDAWVAWQFCLRSRYYWEGDI